MASLKHLSNEDLRKKLKEYGITSPVTASTRNILLKKLNHIISSDKSEQQTSKYSPSVNRNKQTSDEVTEYSSPIRVSPRSRTFNSKASSNSKTDKVRPRLNSGFGDLSLNSFSSDEEDPEERDVQETQPRRSGRRIINDLPPFSSRSVVHNSPTSPHSASSFNNLPIVRKRPGYSPLNLKFLSSPKLNTKEEEYNYDTGSDSDPYDGIDGGNLLQSLGLFSTSKIGSREDSFHSNDIMHRRLNDNSSLLTKNFKNRMDQNGISLKSSLDSPSGDRIAGEITSPEDIVAHETPSSHFQLANGQSPFDCVRRFTSEYCTSDKEFWLPSVPILLVILLAAFFCLLGLCYLSIHTPLGPQSLLSIFSIFNPSSNHIEEIPAISSEKTDKSHGNEGIQNKIPVCSDEIMHNCLTKAEVQNVQDILPILETAIVSSLSGHAHQYQCGKTDLPFVPAEEVANIIASNLKIGKTADEMAICLRALDKLTAINPHWGITAHHGETPLDAHIKLVGFSVTSQSPEIICHITSALYNFVYSIIALLLAFFASWVAFTCFRFYRRQAEETEQKSFELVERILEVLENSCGTGGKEYLAVNHVRDCLLRPRERKTKSLIWDKAVAFIDQHDSRVYREVRSVGGEDCEVWRWVCGAPRSPISCPKAALLPDSPTAPEKMWQGQAFESLETTHNLPQVSPTSCLKIRNMFDAELEFGDSWPRRIQDSLLEKCEGVTVTHIAVDRVSKEGCVYVKCASPAEAGKAFRALHGWWFDGNLVTVKYLREERYYERFPTARNATAALVPSNNKRLSLQLCSSSSAPPLGAPSFSTPRAAASATRRSLAAS